MILPPSCRMEQPAGEDAAGYEYLAKQLADLRHASCDTGWGQVHYILMCTIVLVGIHGHYTYPQLSMRFSESRLALR